MGIFDVKILLKIEVDSTDGAGSCSRRTYRIEIFDHSSISTDQDLVIFSSRIVLNSVSAEWVQAFLVFEGVK